jgi:hypothetical protein
MVVLELMAFGRRGGVMMLRYRVESVGAVFVGITLSNCPEVDTHPSYLIDSEEAA